MGVESGPREIRGAITLAQGLQGQKTSLLMNCNKSWDWPMRGPKSLSHGGFLMSTKLCKALLFLEVGTSRGSRLWDGLPGPELEWVSTWAGGLRPGEEASHRSQRTFQQVRASTSNVWSAEHHVGGLDGLKVQAETVLSLSQEQRGLDRGLQSQHCRLLAGYLGKATRSLCAWFSHLWYGAIMTPMLQVCC